MTKIPHAPDHPEVVVDWLESEEGYTTEDFVGLYVPTTLPDCATEDQKRLLNDVFDPWSAPPIGVLAEWYERHDTATYRQESPGRPWLTLADILRGHDLDAVLAVCQPVECEACRGEGRVFRDLPPGPKYVEELMEGETCPDCVGTGRAARWPLWVAVAWATSKLFPVGDPNTPGDSMKELAPGLRWLAQTGRMPLHYAGAEEGLPWIWNVAGGMQDASHTSALPRELFDVVPGDDTEAELTVGFATFPASIRAAAMAAVTANAPCPACSGSLAEISEQAFGSVVNAIRGEGQVGCERCNGSSWIKFLGDL